MKGMLRKVGTVFLSVCLATTLTPSAAFAVQDSADTTDTSVATISATGASTVTVKQGSSSTGGPVHSGLLQISDTYASISRNYGQSAMLTVLNASSEPVRFYLTTQNDYPDLSLEPVGDGSEDQPMLLAAGESTQVNVSVYAQNAEQSSYVIPVTAHVYAGGEYADDAQNNLRLTCQIPNAAFKWEKLSEDDATLKQSYRVTNTSDEVTDLTVTAEGDVADYVSFSPSVSNLSVGRNESFEIDVIPDLAKMKADDVSSLEGSLVATAAGQSSANDIVVDTKGQEITVTTMGRLALIQDGKPYTDFIVAAASLSLQYNAGSGMQDVAPTTALYDMLKEDGTFDFEYEGDLDLGLENARSFSMTAKSAVATAGEIESGDTYSIEADGNDLVVKMRFIVSQSEYQSYLANGTSTSLLQDSSLLTARDAEPGDSDVAMEFALTVNDAMETLNPDLGHTPLTYVGWMIDAAEGVGVVGESYAFSSNPNTTPEERLEYNSATAAKILLMAGTYAVAATNPAVGIVFSVLASPLEKAIDQWRDSLLLNAGKSAIYARYAGYQCTNRGSIEAHFYAPDYSTSSDSKPSMYATSRMYGKGVVDQQDTNYEVTLNGKKASETQSAGVTDVAIAEVSTDSLNPGSSNHLEFDYDTSPGHDFISTDTEVTLLYPNDAEIGYIGSPENLQEVRSLPDFCIYSENIYGNDPIVNESSTLTFKVYNRGSRGGWFNVTCSAGDVTLADKQNIYLEAFSGKEFTVDWTPSSDATGVTVTLENTTVGISEKSSDNNSATQTVAARNRVIPSVSLSGNGTFLAGQPVRLVVNVSDTNDVTGDVSFNLDESTEPTSVTRLNASNGSRYLVEFVNGMTAGAHKLNVAVPYASAGGASSSHTASIELTAADGGTYEIAVPEGLSYQNVWVYGRGIAVECDITKGNGSVSIAKTLDMVLNPSDYNVIITSDSSAYVVNMAQENPSVSNEDCNELTLAESEDVEISGITLDSVEIGNRYYYLGSTQLDKSKRLYFAPGIYQLRVDGTVQGAPVGGYYAVDMTDGDASFDLASNSFVRTFSFAGQFEGEYSAAFFGKFSNSDMWHTSQLDADYNSDANSITCYDRSSWVLSSAEDYQKAYLAITADNEIYIVPLDVENGLASDMDTLDKDSLHRVTFVCEEDSWEVGVVNVTSDSNYLASINGSTVYVPSGDYSFSLTLFTKSNTLTTAVEQTVTGDCEIAIPGSAEGFANVSIAWPDAFAQTGYTNCTVGSSTFGETSLSNGGEIAVLPGSASFNVYLESVGAYFTIFRQADVSADVANSIVIDDEFDGTAQISTRGDVYAGSSLYASIGDLVDANGNRLSNLYSDYETPLVGTATFTDVDDPGKAFNTTATLYSLDSIQFNVPEAPGTYSVSFSISFSKDDSVHTVTFDSLGGSSVDAAAVPSGDIVTRPADPTREGYVFGGWYKDAACTQQWDFSADKVHANTTIYAKWLDAESVHSVSFNAQGGSPIASVWVADGDTVAPPTDPVRSGYTFAGWYTTADYTQEYDFASPVTSDITLYARWSYNGGSQGGGQPSNPGTNPGTGTGEDTTHEVTAPGEVQGGTVDVTPTSAKPGDVVTITPDPDDGQEVRVVVVTDASGSTVETSSQADGTWTFVMPNAEVSVEVVFGCDGGDLCITHGFGDVDTKQWYHDPVDWAVSVGAMHGYADSTLFGPTDGLLREQAATVMWNIMAKGDLEAALSVHHDVSQSDWYAPYVNWAVENGIMQGYSADDFGIGDVLTREQFAAIIANATGADISQSDTSVLSGFPDQSSVSDWAIQTMAWAVKNGVLNGVAMGNGSRELQANRTINRAEMASMLMNAVEAGVLPLG